MQKKVGEHAWILIDNEGSNTTGGQERERIIRRRKKNNVDI